MKTIIHSSLTYLLLTAALCAQNANFSIFDKKKTGVPGNSNLPKPVLHLACDELKGNTTPTESSGMTATVEGAALVPGKIGKAFDFAGENSKIAIGPKLKSLLDDRYTISAWVLPHSARAYGVIFNANVPMGVGLRVWRNNVDFNAGKAFHLITSEDGTVPNEEWTHIAATCDGAVAKLYINGKSVGEKEVQTPLSFADTAEMGQTTEAFREDPTDVGVSKPSQFFQGSIDDLRVYNVVLTDEQIADLAKVAK